MTALSAPLIIERVALLELRPDPGKGSRTLGGVAAPVRCGGSFGANAPGGGHWAPRALPLDLGHVAVQTPARAQSTSGDCVDRVAPFPREKFAAASGPPRRSIPRHCLFAKPCDRCAPFVCVHPGFAVSVTGRAS
jgi:hypothetical protein